MDWRQNVQSDRGLSEIRGIVGVDHRLHGRYAAVRGQRGQTWPDHRLAEDLPVLLRPVAAGAKPAAGCYDHGCDHACHLGPFRKQT
jgi:hypothetical protein